MIRRSHSAGGDPPASRRPSALLVFATGLALATAALVWLAWSAHRDARRNAALLMERRTGEVLALVSEAISRDMKGAWLSVLVPLETAVVREDPPYDLMQLASRAFALFPYPESFIVWTDTRGPDGRTYAFNRSARLPPWDTSKGPGEAYPVTLVQDPAALAPVVARLRAGAARRRRFALVETTIGGVPYQVIVHYLQQPADTAQPAALAAFTVNLDWVRTGYLGDLLHEVAAIGGGEETMAISVFDEHRSVVARSGSASTLAPVRERRFPLLFVEPALVGRPPDGRQSAREWTIEVRPARNTALAAAALGTQMLLLATLAGAASLAAVLMTVRAIRTRSELVTMKSEFVSAVTHELKTPLALIKLVGETLERGRYTSATTIRDYATLLSQEERRLSHLIENLLTYSRLSDFGPGQADDTVDIADIVEDALEPFRPRLAELDFELDVALDPDLPQVRGDRLGLQQVLRNLIDNAIKYSPTTRRLTIEAVADGADVRVRVTDAGIGVPDDELPRVFETFYRGRHARDLGSGLGLAIVRRIVHRHDGQLDIRSRVGGGTTVTVILPGLPRT